MTNRRTIFCFVQKIKHQYENNLRRQRQDSDQKSYGYQICKMAEAFSDAGHDVLLVAPRRLNNIKENIFDYYDIKRNFKLVFLPTIDLIEFGKIGFWIQTISFNICLVFYFLFKKADILYSRDEFSLWTLSFFDFGKSKMFWESHLPKSSFLVGRVLKKCFRVVTITSGLADFYTDTFHTPKNKLIVAPSGIDFK